MSAYDQCPPGNAKRSASFRSQSRGVHAPGAAGVALMVGLALDYGRTAPSVDVLRQRLGCSRATAYRWRRAYVEALRQYAEQQGDGGAGAGGDVEGAQCAAVEGKHAAHCAGAGQGGA